jgi:G3E family GTPase
VLKNIPATIITGFLGSGKTTAINHLLSIKPAKERWAVIINEFGRIGVDSLLASRSGTATIREVPGGCLCCTAGPSFETTLNRLIRETKPDRILIEPTGIAHPLRVIRTLSEGFYREVLDLKAVICLVDGRNLCSERHTAHPAFMDQLSLADVIVSTKPDLLEACHREALLAYAEKVQPPKTALRETAYGQIELDLLDLPRTSGRTAGTPDAHRHHNPAPNALRDEPGDGGQREWLLLEGRGDGFFTAGWRIGTDFCFDAEMLARFFGNLFSMRVKGVLRCREGWMAFNAVEGELSLRGAPAAGFSRLEVINDLPLAALDLDQQLRCCLEIA